jgi:AraC-like DNA-binding protein
MEIPVAYIGFAQAIFIALLIFLKNPLKIADRILAIFLISIALMFALNIAQVVTGVTQGTWIFSVSISFTFPSLLFLYAKYVTVDFGRFHSKDYLHALPFLVTISLIFLFRNPAVNFFNLDLDYYEQLKWLRNGLGSIFILLLWIYGYFALRKILHYRLQRSNLYSYDSNLNSLNWLLLFVVTFIVIEHVIIIGSTLQELGIKAYEIKSVNNWSLLFFVYVAGIWGFRQNQLASEVRPTKFFQPDLSEESVSEKYQKSSLKGEQAATYLEQLKQYMEESKAWKDKELSVSKISEQTQISKHHITQALNEHLGKNFYSFVNEYRISEAKEMISSGRYAAWSLVAVANECGFNSKTAFNNFFKKTTGFTPSEYREKAKI